MNILTLDIAHTTGYAIYSSTTEKILFVGNEKFNGSFKRGEIYMLFYEWLGEVCEKYHIKKIIAEDIYKPTMSEHISDKSWIALAGMQAILKYFALSNGLGEVVLIMPNSHHLSLTHITYPRKKVKEETVKRVNCLLGKDASVSSDDEADAVSILLYWIKRNNRRVCLPSGKIYCR